jgi:predicted flap endonuclease-1-like 5' DNA nuclease
MDGLSSDLWLLLLAAAAGGGVVGWLIRDAVGNSRISTLNDSWQDRLDNVVRVRDRLIAEADTLRTSIEAQEAVVHRRDMAITKARTELESALERQKHLTKDIFTLRAEREDTKSKMASFQDRMVSLQQQSSELQNEFLKSRDFYVGELKKAFEKRSLLEEKLDNSKHEYESFSNLLQSSRTEHESVNKMLAAAKSRLANLDKLEQDVIKLEAENAQLKHDNALVRQEIDAQNRDIAENEELKIQNKELAQVLRSMESSRSQYENDANRYREHADKTEKKSETLRVRLDEVEKNFLEIEKQQSKALKAARASSATVAANDSSSAEDVKDDLKEIIGIGKVFEHTLHELGVFNFRQIANFGVADISRVNAELREFKGRMEQDDWVGQAKELHFKKYGSG